MTRKTILEQIKKDLEDNLHSSNNYKSDPTQIIEGITNFDDAIQRPVIAFMLTSDTIMDEDLGAEDGRERILNLLFYGYEDASYNNYGPLYDLIDDVEKFLMNTTDFTYTDQTLLGNVSLWTGGVDFNRAYFTLEVQVYYTQTLD